VSDAYGEAGKADKKDKVDQLFMAHFAQHPMAAASVLRTANEKLKAGDVAGALTIFQKVDQDFAGSALHLNALSGLASCYNKLDQPAEEIKALARYVEKAGEKERPGPTYIGGLLRLGNAQRALGTTESLNEAIKTYEDLLKRLADKPGIYRNTPADEESNAKMQEAARFFIAYTRSSLTEPTDKVAAFKQQARGELDKFVATYPKSAWAPAALSRMGSILMGLEKVKEAEEAILRLQKQYPESTEAKNSDYLLAKSLLEMGKTKQAVEVFKKMFASAGGTYTPQQLLLAAKTLVEAKEYTEALAGFDRIIESKDAKAGPDAMLGKGRALVEMGKQKQGAELLEKVMTDNPRGRYIVEASLYISRAYCELGLAEADEAARQGLFNAGVDAINRARAREQSEAGKLRLNAEVGNIFELKAKAEEKYGTPDKVRAYKDKAISTYQIMMMSAATVAGEPAARAVLEDAYARYLPLLVDAQSWEDVQLECDRYLKLIGDKGRIAGDVRSWREQARVKTAVKGAAGGTTP